MDKLYALLDHPWMHTVLGCVALVILAWFCAWLTRHVLKRVMKLASRRTRWRWDDAMVKRGVFLRLAQVVPMLIIYHGLVAVPGVPASAEAVVRSIAALLMVVFVVMTVNAALTACDDLYQHTPRGREHTIKGYVQLGKIAMWLVGAILIIAIVFNRSPLTLLAGLGAVSAVILLIFKDTIMSVVASLQLGSNDMLRVGDWISLPDDNVDGDVIEIALHTVKVVNWDKTISTVPTWHLISKSYRNYRHMYATGRRIARAVNVDLTSVRFLQHDEIEHLREFNLLTDYFDAKEKDVAAWNANLGEAGKQPVNQRRLSNLGTFRAYVQAYAAACPAINHDLFWAVRQMDPGPTGVPIQIYGYTIETGFVAHHNAQGDIFDHLIAILPEFGLKLFQQPTGNDVRAGLAGQGHGPASESTEPLLPPG